MQLPFSRYQQNMEVNYFGTIRVTQAFLGQLRRRKDGRGRLVNIGSIGARMPSAFGSAYLSTKAAMLSYSECVRQEVHRFGMSVASIEPGFFATGLLTDASKNGAAESRNESQRGVYPSYDVKMAATAKTIQGLEQLNGGVSGSRCVADAVIDACCSRLPKRRCVHARTLVWL